MHVVQFERSERIIWVPVTLWGPLGEQELQFILDTGTSVTVVNTAIIDKLGYSAKMGTTRSRLVGVEGAQEGYQLEVKRIAILGLTIESCEVYCHDFEDRFGVQGLVGMDLLIDREIFIDGPNGVLKIGP